MINIMTANKLLLEKHTGFRRVIKATVHSMHGFKSVWREEAAFRQELILAIGLFLLACWLDVSMMQRIAMIAVLFIVLIVEVLNSAIEATIDRIGPEIHQLSKNAKDMGSFAVFLSLALAMFVWAMILLAPYFSAGS
jgi:diacylglycerol kinase (ATP)